MSLTLPLHQPPTQTGLARCLPAELVARPVARPVATEVAVPVESSGGNDKPTVYTMLKELKELLDVGVLSQAEFDEQKKAILSSS